MKKLNFLLLFSVFLVFQPAIAMESMQIKVSEKEKAAYLQNVQATLILSENLSELSAEGEQQEDLESAPSSPPLTTDDTGTPGPNGVEINLLMDCDRSKAAKGCERLVDANYGIGDKIQIKIERDYGVERNEDGVVTRGLGPTEFGVKYRFYDKNGLSAAIYPQITIDNSKKHSSDPSAEIEREGNTVYIPVIISKELGKYTVVTNTGYRHSYKSSEDDAIIAGVAIARALDERSRIMGEIYSERDRNLHNRRTDVRVGYVRIVSPKSSKYEISAFVSAGHSLGQTEDGFGHTTLQFGLSLVRKPKSQSVQSVK